MELKQLPFVALYRYAVAGMVLQCLCSGHLWATANNPKQKSIQVINNKLNAVAVTVTGVVAGDDGEVRIAAAPAAARAGARRC